MPHSVYNPKITIMDMLHKIYQNPNLIGFQIRRCIEMFIGLFGLLGFLAFLVALLILVSPWLWGVGTRIAIPAAS